MLSCHVTLGLEFGVVCGGIILMTGLHKRPLMGRLHISRYSRWTWTICQLLAALPMDWISFSTYYGKDQKFMDSFVDLCAVSPKYKLVYSHPSNYRRVMLGYSQGNVPMFRSGMDCPFTDSRFLVSPTRDFISNIFGNWGAPSPRRAITCNHCEGLPSEFSPFIDEFPHGFSH